MADPTIEDRLELLKLQQRLQRVSQVASPEKQREVRSILATMDHWAGIIGTRLQEGMANVIGLPIDLMGAMMDQVWTAAGYTPIGARIGGSASIKRGLRAVGVPMPEEFPAETMAQRFVGTVAQEIGATAPFAAIPFGIAAKAPAASIKPPSAFMRPFIQEPGRTAGVELTAATGGGTGAQAAREAFPGSALAETIGRIAGGVAAVAPIAAGQLMGKGIRRVTEPLSEVGLRRRVQRQLAQGIGERPTQEIIGDIDRVSRELAKVEVTPTTAQIAGEPGLLAIERSVSRRGAREAGIFRDIWDSQKRQVRQALDAAAPEGSPISVGEALDDQLRQMKVRFDREIIDADARVRQAIAASGGDPIEANRVIRMELSNAEKAMEGRARAMFEAIDPAKQVRGSMARLKLVVQKMRGKVALSRDDKIIPIRKAEAPESMPDAAKAIAGLDNTESLDEIMALRSRLTDDIRAESVLAAPNKLKISRLELLKDTADDVILNDLIPSESIEAPGAMYEAARQFFRTHVADRFRRGTVAKVLRRGALGEPSAVPESATIQQFFKSGRGASEAAEDFRRVLTDNRQARQALRDAVTHDYASFATRPDGTFDPARARAWIARHSDALKKFPDIDHQVNSILRLGDEASFVRTNVEKSIQRFERSAARFFLDADPQKAIRSILQSKNPSGGLKVLVQQLKGRPEALNGLRASFWENMVQAGEVGVFDEKIAKMFISPNRLRRFFHMNKRHMIESGLFTREQVGRVDKIINAAEVINRSVVSGLPGGSDTAQNIAAMRSLEALAVRGVFSRFFGRVFGIHPTIIVSPQQIVSQTFHRFWGRYADEQINSLLVRSLVDPEVAKTLLMPMAKGTEKEIARRLRLHLINLGPTAIRASEEE